MSGLTDASMEKNPLPEEEVLLGSTSGTADGQQTAIGQSHSARADVRRTIFLLAGVIALAVVLIAGLIAIQKAKKRPEKPKSGIGKRKKNASSSAAERVQFQFQPDATEEKKKPEE